MKSKRQKGQEYQDWIEKYQSGWSLQEIAEYAQRAKETVRMVLKHRNVQMRSRGDRPGPQSFHWKGGKGTIAHDGSLVVRRKSKNSYISRLVMEKILGRPLKNVEIVHHINGDKTDNGPENLRLFSSQSEHARFHNLGKSL